MIMNNLPYEIIRKVGCYLAIKDIARIASTCREIYSIFLQVLKSPVQTKLFFNDRFESEVRQYNSCANAWELKDILVQATQTSGKTVLRHILVMEKSSQQIRVMFSDVHPYQQPVFFCDGDWRELFSLLFDEPWSPALTIHMRQKCWWTVTQLAAELYQRLHNWFHQCLDLASNITDMKRLHVLKHHSSTRNDFIFLYQ